MAGQSTPRNLPNPTATAAMVPVWMIVKSVQPKRNPITGPMASFRNTYWPPARGNMAASSASDSAPASVITPVRTQAISNQNGEPSVRAMSDETMKMPEPIIEPATSMAASVNVSAATNPVGADDEALP